MQSVYSIETYAYGTTKDLLKEKEEIKCNNIVKQFKKMINVDKFTKENIKEHNPNWSQILDPPHRILMIGGTGSEKTNSLFNLLSRQPDIDKIYLHAKYPYKNFNLQNINLWLTNKKVQD